MADASRSSNTGPDPAALLQLASPGLQTEFLGRAAELFANAAKAIWECQADLLQIEAESGLKAFPALKPGANPTDSLAALCRQWHDNSEKVISRMRAVNDVTREYSWQMLDLYAESMRRSANRPTPS